MGDSQIVLFYSNHCEHSKNFVQQLNESNISINMVSVDNTPRHRIPAVVRSVPTLVVAGQPEPLVGDQVFAWLKAQQQRAASARQQQQKQQQQGGAEDGPTAWQMEEMGGSFSDGYSFLESATGSSIPKSFAFLDDSPQAHQITGGGGGAQQPQQPQFQQQPQQPQFQQQPQQPQQPQFQHGGGGGPGMVSGGAPAGYHGSGGGGGQPMFQDPPVVQQQRGQDELSQRMETLQQNRDSDIPRGNGNGHMRFEDLPVPSR